MTTKTAVRLMKKHWQFYLIAALPIAYIIIYRYWPMAGAQIAFRKFNVVQGIWGSP